MARFACEIHGRSPTGTFTEPDCVSDQLAPFFLFIVQKTGREPAKLEIEVQVLVKRPISVERNTATRHVFVTRFFGDGPDRLQRLGRKSSALRHTFLV